MKWLGIVLSIINVVARACNIPGVRRKSHGRRNTTMGPDDWRGL